MSSERSIGCYRCGGQMQRIASAEDTSEIGTRTVHLVCERCGQQYELQYSLAAIFATSPEGEAQALLLLCEHCGQLYQAQRDEPHICREVGPSLPNVGTEIEGGET